jgi:hypothetical protein
MKKPNFIEIRIPCRKSTMSAAVKGYFKRLEEKVLKVNFGELKERKLFEYRVKESNFQEIWNWYEHRKFTCWVLKLELKVPKEDPNKVL